MMEAIFGLVGVIIGAVISGVINYVLQKRKEQMAARVAARLVREELYLVAVWVEDLLNQENVGAEQFRKIKARTGAGAWPEQRIHLAAAMNYKAYADASMAVGAVYRFLFWLDTKENVNSLEDQDRILLQEILERLRPGLETLKDVAQ